MDKRSKRKAAVVAIVVAIAGWAILLNQRTHQAPERTESPSQEAVSGTKRTQAPPTERGVAPGFPESARKEVASCLSEREGAVSSLDSLVRELTPPNEEGKKLQTRNIHVRLPSGEKRRVHLFADSSADGKAIQRLRVFGEDEEGLPVPLAIPSDEEVNPSQSVIEKQFDGGTVEWTEEKWQVPVQDGGLLEWTLDNGAVVEFHLQRPDLTLGCAENEARDSVDCLCRK